MCVVGRMALSRPRAAAPSTRMPKYSGQRGVAGAVSVSVRSLGGCHWPDRSGRGWAESSHAWDDWDGDDPDGVGGRGSWAVVLPSRGWVRRSLGGGKVGGYRRFLLLVSHAASGSAEG